MRLTFQLISLVAENKFSLAKIVQGGGVGIGVGGRVRCQVRARVRVTVYVSH